MSIRPKRLGLRLVLVLALLALPAAGGSQLVPEDEAMYEGETEETGLILMNTCEGTWVGMHCEPGKPRDCTC